MDTVNIFIRLPKEELVYLSGLIESYDDLAVVRTLDPAEVLVALMVSPHEEKTIGDLLAILEEDRVLEILDNQGHWEAVWREKIYGVA